ncbi:MAG: undecaprenyl-diphosphate phosphatase [Bacilli bacterium]|nr:undecaprenyl-diphosphate phosphatase [Bacilli bacterium]
MDFIIDIIKAIIFGIVEGITEWLPISSTGHMLILEEFFSLKETQGEDFFEFFLVIIQLAAILAVVLHFFVDLWPFGKNKTQDEKKMIWSKWANILLASIPAAVFGILFDDWLDEHFHNFPTVATTLIIYGLAFIVIESLLVRKKYSAKKRYHLDAVSSTVNECHDPYCIFKTHHVEHITCSQAMIIGLAQVLALIPGTSRSGVTICAALLLSIDRTTATEFSFYLSIPAMLGGSLIKTISFVHKGNVLTGNQLAILGVACLFAFIVSLLAINFLLRFLRSRTFISFGIYRIILGGILLIVYFAAIRNAGSADVFIMHANDMAQTIAPSGKIQLPMVNHRFDNAFRIGL